MRKQTRCSAIWPWLTTPSIAKVRRHLPVDGYLLTGYPISSPYTACTPRNRGNLRPAWFASLMSTTWAARMLITTSGLILQMLRLPSERVRVVSLVRRAVVDPENARS